MNCCFCGNETEGKLFWDANLNNHKREKFNVCNDCVGEDLEMVDEKD